MILALKILEKNSHPTPLVSVCVTTYNHAPYIARAVESILAQECNFGVEIILSDDCSQDSTADICRSYAERYPDRIKFLTSEHNVGMRANYRRCVEAARGQYVAMCDGDDWWCDANKLAMQVAVMEQDGECGLCYTRSERRQGGKVWRYPSGEMFCDFDNLLFNNTVENCTALARRELIMRYYAEVRPEEHPEWLTDDAPMWIWFAANSKLRTIEIPTAVHLLLPESVSQSGNYQRRIAFCDSLVDISLWFDNRYSHGKYAPRLYRKRMEVALWVLSRDGSTAEYLNRWWCDVRRTPRLLLNLAGYGLLVKRWLRLLSPARQNQ